MFVFPAENKPFFVKFSLQVIFYEPVMRRV